MMRLKKSYVIAALLALALIGWLWSGQIDGEPPVAVVETEQQPAPTAKAAPIAVQVQDLVAETIERRIIANGKTSANREVQLRGEISGRVIDIGPAEGTLVRPGDVLVRLDPRDREVALLQAKAVLRQRQIEREAARQLNRKGFQAETALAEAEANHAIAEAALKRAELDLDHTEIRAPFAGILDRRDVEIGDFIDIGETIATVIDVDPLLIVGEVIETEVGKLETGMQGVARLATGKIVSGRLRYIGSRADQQTRTFSIELEVPNVEGLKAVGVSAELSIAAEEVVAHKVSPAVLSLNDAGALGVKTVDEDNKVVFMPVEIARAEEGAVWLSGLPEKVRLITVGQGFVRHGSLVDPVSSAPQMSEQIVSEVIE